MDEQSLYHILISKYHAYLQCDRDGFWKQRLKPKGILHEFSNTTTRNPMKLYPCFYSVTVFTSISSSMTFTRCPRTLTPCPFTSINNKIDNKILEHGILPRYFLSPVFSIPGIQMFLFQVLSYFCRNNVVYVVQLQGKSNL